MLSQSELQRYVSYDPETGAFRWLTSSGKRKAGNVAGNVATNGYVRFKVCGKKYPAHCLAWLYMTGEWPSDEVDHIDRNRANNSWRNLRVLSHVENCQNRSLRGYSNSGRLGVSWDKSRSRWLATICHNYQTYRLGGFKNLIDAVAARMAAERKLFTHLPSA